jgi:Tfp pilus assembly protein PilF
MRQTKIVGVIPVLFLLACGGGSGSSEGAKAPVTTDGKGGQIYAVSQQAEKEHSAALDEFLRADQKFDWNEAKCRSIAEKFVKASEEQQSVNGTPLPTALYNAGVTYMRCGMEREALEQFQAASSADPNFHRGRAQMALFDYQRSKDIDGAVSNLEQVIRDAKFQNVEALVSVAALQMERGGETQTEDGANDLERAKKNIQRALAIDDNYMPAFNQLAIYYMEAAKQQAAGKSAGRRRGLVVAGAKKTRVNQQQLELAALVASQAIQKNGNYAPIHNTAGLIQVQMDNYNGAVKSFAAARTLDPKFFEAHMNYAAVNLSFRGFVEAEKAYREALKLIPGDYEALLGLALAVRGQVNDANFDKYVAESQKYLDECKKVDGSRPEAYYNEAILTQEFRAKSSGDIKKSIPTLNDAIARYEAFISKAGSAPEFAEAVKRSQDRIQDIKDTIKFIEEGEKARIEEEAENARMKEDEARLKKEEEERLKKEAADKAAADKATADKAAADKAAADKAAADKAAADKAKATGGKPADAKAAGAAAPAAGAKPAAPAAAAPAAKPAAPVAPAKPAAPPVAPKK